MVSLTRAGVNLSIQAAYTSRAYAPRARGVIRPTRSVTMPPPAYAGVLRGEARRPYAPDCGGGQCPSLAVPSYQVVVVGRAAVRGLGDWAVLDPRRTPAEAWASMFHCPDCDAWQWFAPGHCRACGSDGWDGDRRYHVPGTTLLDPNWFGSGNVWPNDIITGLPFAHAPR